MQCSGDGRFVMDGQRSVGAGAKESSQKARNTTLNTAKRPSKAEDVRDRPNKRRLASKSRQLMSTRARSVSFLPSATNDSASKSRSNPCCNRRKCTRSGWGSLCCISLWPASRGVLHRWASAKGAVQLACFRAIIPHDFSRSLQGSCPETTLQSTLPVWRSVRHQTAVYYAAPRSWGNHVKRC